MKSITVEKFRRAVHVPVAGISSRQVLVLVDDTLTDGVRLLSSQTLRGGQVRTPWMCDYEALALICFEMAPQCELGLLKIQTGKRLVSMLPENYIAMWRREIYVDALHINDLVRETGLKLNMSISAPLSAWGQCRHASDRANEMNQDQSVRTAIQACTDAQGACEAVQDNLVMSKTVNDLTTAEQASSLVSLIPYGPYSKLFHISWDLIDAGNDAVAASSVPSSHVLVGA